MLKTVTLKYINQQLFIQKCLKYRKTYRDSTEGAHFYTILRRGEKNNLENNLHDWGENHWALHNIQIFLLSRSTWATATFMEHAWQAAAHH